jgi:hypothetical protein
MEALAAHRQLEQQGLALYGVGQGRLLPRLRAVQQLQLRSGRGVWRRRRRAPVGCGSGAGGTAAGPRQPRPAGRQQALVRGKGPQAKAGALAAAAPPARLRCSRPSQGRGLLGRRRPPAGRACSSPGGSRLQCRSAVLCSRQQEGPLGTPFPPASACSRRPCVALARLLRRCAAHLMVCALGSSWAEGLPPAPPALCPAPGGLPGRRSRPPPPAACRGGPPAPLSPAFPGPGGAAILRGRRPSRAVSAESPGRVGRTGSIQRART